MSTTATKLQLTTDDHQELVRCLDHPILGSDSFVRWVSGGADTVDIERNHAQNVINSVASKPEYQKLRNRLMAKYEVAETELMVATLHRFAATRRR